MLQEQSMELLLHLVSIWNVQDFYVDMQEAR